MAAKIYVVSVGPGSQEYLLPIAIKLVNEGNCIAGGKRNLELFITAGKQIFEIKNNLEELKSFLETNLQESPIVLASGDAGFYGILSFLRRHFPSESLEVIAGVSSMQLAFARLADTWQDALLLSLHGRELNNLQTLLSHHKIGILTDKQHSPQALASLLIEVGAQPREIVVFDNLTYEDEYCWRGNVNDLAVLAYKFKNSVVVIYNG